MLKRFMWLLSLTVLLSFISCGGGSSKEAKELLERLLRVVGIPYNIVVNICQDDNNNGFCESIEIQAKLNINKNDSAKDIWEKLQLSSDGSYLLAHHDPTKNIIMEIQDQEHLKYNSGMLSFFYNPMTQELSILQALVDSGYLRQNEITAVQAMDNRPALDKVLLNSLFYNQNILMESNLSVNIAMSNNFAYLAEGLRELNVSNQLPRRIDQCNRNQACIDTILNPTSLRLEIDNAEVTQIVQNQGGESSSSTDNSTPYTPESLTGSDSGAFKTEEDGSFDPSSETKEPTPIDSNALGNETTQPTPTDNNASNGEITEPTPTDNNASNDETTESTPTPTPITSTPIGKTEKNGADGYIVKLSKSAYAICDNREAHYSNNRVGVKGKLTFSVELTDDCLITIPKGATIDSNNNGKYDYTDKTLTFDMKAFANADFITPLTTLLVLKKKNGEDISAFEAMVKSFDPVEASNRVATQSGVEKVTTQKLMLLMEVLKTPNLSITNMTNIDISDITVTSSSESISDFDIDKLIALLPRSVQTKAKARANISQELTTLLGDLDTNKIDLATFMTNISDGGIKIKSAIRGAKHQGMFISDTNTIGDIIKSSADRSSVEATLARLNSLLNNAPTAHAGRDQTVTEGVPVVLSGSLSSDIDNDIVDYLWKDGDMSIGNGVSLTKSDFSVGTHTITLVVTDEEGVMASDDVVIVVNEKVVAEPVPTATPTPIPTSNTTQTSTSKLKKTGQTTSYEQFDDGYYQIGITPSYSKSGDIVTDNVTGLQWQDDEKMEYQNSPTWSDAWSYCSSLSLLDKSDWRLPTIKELLMIVDDSKYNTAFDSTFIHPTSRGYWSSTLFAYDSNHAWLVYFSNGSMTFLNKMDEMICVRCVRGGQLLQAGFSRDSNGIVVDSATGLAWQDDYHDNEGEIKRTTWKDALVYCEGLSLGGKSDWRLPNKNELFSIVDISKYNYAISSVFTSVPSRDYYTTDDHDYWSSTSSASDSSHACVVSFYSGCVYANGDWRSYKKDEHSVRCVRGGQ